MAISKASFNSALAASLLVSPFGLSDEFEKFCLAGVVGSSEDVEATASRMIKTMPINTPSPIYKPVLDLCFGAAITLVAEP